MAKSTAYCKCRVCGKTWTKELYGRNRKTADEKAEWYEGEFDICEDCEDALRDAEHEALKVDKAESNADNEANLIKPVDLKGTARQVRWAEDIRGWLVKALQVQEDGNNKFAVELEELEPGERYKYLDAIEFLAQVSNAGWWIEFAQNHDVHKYSLHLHQRAYYLAKESKDFTEWLGSDEANLSKEELEAKHNAALVMPEDAKTTTEATVSVKSGSNYVDVESDKDTLIINVLKNAGYRWYGKDGTWSKVFDSDLTDPEDAIAETANLLLNEGVPVIVKDETAREKAITGDYEPMPTRTISEKNGSLMIGWEGRDDEIYKDARRIKGSDWDYDNKKVKVSPKHYMDIEGFAEMHGFILTPAAQKAIDDARTEALAATVKVAKHKKATQEEFDGSAILERKPEVMNKHILEA